MFIQVNHKKFSKQGGNLGQNSEEEISWDKCKTHSNAGKIHLPTHKI